MFRNTYQHGLLTVFYSCGANPLVLWDVEVKNGHVKRITDEEVNSIVLELMSTNVATTSITCPKGKQSLGIKLPILVMIVKNMKRYFSFEITILDDRQMRRRFRISNFQTTTKIKPFCTSMPLNLSKGWNQIQFDLADFTNRAYLSNLVETVSVQVYASVRIRRIYFCNKLYTEDELPQDYKLYLPTKKVKKVVTKSRSKETPKTKSKSENIFKEQENKQESMNENVAESQKPTLIAPHTSYQEILGTNLSTKDFTEAIMNLEEVVLSKTKLETESVTKIGFTEQVLQKPEEKIAVLTLKEQTTDVTKEQTMFEEKQLKEAVKNEELVNELSTEEKIVVEATSDADLMSKADTAKNNVSEEFLSEIVIEHELEVEKETQQESKTE